MIKASGPAAAGGFLPSATTSPLDQSAMASFPKSLPFPDCRSLRSLCLAGGLSLVVSISSQAQSETQDDARADKDPAPAAAAEGIQNLAKAAEAAKEEPAMKDLKELTVKESAFRHARPPHPTAVHSDDEAEAIFEGESLAALRKEVDFSKEQAVVFAWQGSGQDRIKADNGKSGMLFDYEPGRTRDLRQHTVVFVLPKNDSWAVAADWEEIKAMILADKVKDAAQLHSREVTVVTKDGIRYRGTEPMLDDLIKFIQENDKKIPIATE
jgi:hypothetical protein